MDQDPVKQPPPFDALHGAGPVELRRRGAAYLRADERGLFQIDSKQYQDALEEEIAGVLDLFERVLILLAVLQKKELRQRLRELPDLAHDEIFSEHRSGSSGSLSVAPYGHRPVLF